LQASGQPQGFQNGGGVHGAAGSGALIQKGEPVPQGAVRQAGQKLRAVVRQGDGLPLCHKCQPGGDILRGDALKGEALAAGENRGGHLVQLGGSENEHQVLGGFLQNFQQSVERGDGEHMDFVDDVYALFHMGGGVDSLVPQGADLIDAVVGGGVQLQHVQEAAVFNAEAGGTLAAGVAVLGMLAVDGLGQDFGAGGLAGAAGAGEQVGVGRAALCHLPAQSLGDMGLAYDIGKRLGPPFAVECLIHGTSFWRACPAGAFRQGEMPMTSPPYAAAEPAPSRHMENPAECCSVPRLTWFAGIHCARPAPQLHAEDFNNNGPILLYPAEIINRKI